MGDLISLHAVVKKWREEGINLLPPADIAQATAALNQTGRKYSQDVVTLYCATGGMNDDDSRFWSLWSLDRVVTETSRYARPYILFADFLIDSYFYCFRYEDDERSSVCIDYLNQEEPKHVADSVGDFFDIYLRHPEQLGMFDLNS